MKAIVLATAFTMVEFVAITAVLRSFPSRRRVLQMTAAYLVVLLCLVTTWVVTPDNLGLIPRPLLAEPRWFDLAASIFFFSAAYFGGILQLYNLADRGFSLRIAIDLLEHDLAGMSADDVVRGYSSGQGLRWMYQKRIDGMVSSGLIAIADGVVSLEPKGFMLAGLFSTLRRILKIESGA